MRPSIPSWVRSIRAWWSTITWTRRKKAKYATYATIFDCLIAFFGLTLAYLYIPSNLQTRYPQSISTATFTATAITCGYPLSGIYGITPVTIIWILVPLTIIVRRAPWLCAGLASIVMVYSATSVVHLAVLFRFNNRWAPDERWNGCEELPLPGGGVLPICRGIHDPDYIIAGGVVAANLLAVLPFAKWSFTFRRPETKTILVLWTLLLAVGHLFFIFIIPNPGLNYQICPVGAEAEPLPGMDYHASDRDWRWDARLLDIVFNQTSTIKPTIVTGEASPQCLYTCFGRDNYLGRRRDEIGVFPASLSNRYLNKHLRGVGIAFWAVYALLAAVGLFVSREHDGHWDILQVDKWSDTTRARWGEAAGVVTLRSVRQGLRRWLKRKAWWERLTGTLRAVFSSLQSLVQIISQPGGKAWELIMQTGPGRLAARWTTKAWEWVGCRLKMEFRTEMGFSSACLICLVKRVVQFLSAVSFFGFVIFGYLELVQIPNSEPPIAVGQWSSISGIVFVLTAAVVGKVSGSVSKRGEKADQEKLARLQWDEEEARFVQNSGATIIQLRAVVAVEFGPTIEGVSAALENCKPSEQVDLVEDGKMGKQKSTGGYIYR